MASDLVFESLLEERGGKGKREELIKSLEKKLGSRVIVWMSRLGHPLANIIHDDIPPLGDALASVGKCKRLDLILDSPGGDADTAEKVLKMCRQLAEEFRVIVPNCAKSAATLIALGSDEIIMGYLSELGPIDPQMIQRSPDGTIVSRPAQSYLDSVEEIQRQIDAEKRIPEVYLPYLQRLDPAFLNMCHKARLRAQYFAEEWLKKYMLKDDPVKAKEIAAVLADANRHLSHSKVIDHEEAKAMGLNVTLLPQDDPAWTMIWELYCRTLLVFSDTKAYKLFETSRTNILVTGR